MITTPAVSIIIPIYNAQLHLNECIDSARNQTLANIELLCVDDGSSDQSYAMLQALSALDSRIRVFRQANDGAGSARNLAIREAAGEYLCFLDADDCYASDTCLQSLYTAAKLQNVSICGGFRQLLHPDGTITPHPLFRRALKRNPQGLIISYEDFQYDYHYQNFLFQRALLEKNHIVFPPYRRFQDPPFLVRAMLAAQSFAVIPAEVYRYRINERPIEWTKEKVAGLLQGLTENLLLSREESLPWLHALTVWRIEREYYEAIAGQFSQQEIRHLVETANASVDEQLLKQGRAMRGRFLLPPFQAHTDFAETFGRSKRTSPRPPASSSGSLSKAFFGFFRSVREHGLSETIRRSIERFIFPMNTALPRQKHSKQ